MNLNVSDLDKMIYHKTARKLPPAVKGRRFLRSFSIYSRKNLLTFLLGGLFLLGILMGTLLVSRSSPETLDMLKIILGGYLERRQTQSFSAIAISTFSSIFVSLLILFFCGFCTISQLIIFVVPFFKGLGYGFSVGTLYAQYGSNAIKYTALLLLPAMFMGTLLIIMACRASLMLSVTLFKSTLVSPDQADTYRAKRYCVKYIIFTFICVLISLIDAALFCQFSGLFVL